MQKSYIQKRLSKTYQALWELSRHGQVDSDIAKKLKEMVQDARLPFKSSRDPLEEKVDKFGNDGTWAERKIQELAKVIYTNKQPDDVALGDWISVEIECLFPSSHAENAFVLFVRKNGHSKYVTLKDDGSIHADEIECECERDDDGEVDCHCEAGENRGYGKEIVITFRYGDWEFVKAVCRQLNSVGCFINKTCGLHVHFDCRHLTQRQVTTVGKRIARAVPALKQILPPSRRENRFCSVDINKHPTGSRRGSGDSRYAFVNLEAYSRHKTIEIRGHSGTTDATKIVNWIRILRQIMDRRNTAVVNTVSEMVSTFKFEDGLAEYVIQRYRKFLDKKTPSHEDDVANDNMGDTVSSVETVSGDIMDAVQYSISIPRGYSVSGGYGRVGVEFTPINISISNTDTAEETRRQVTEAIDRENMNSSGNAA